MRAPNRMRSPLVTKYFFSSLGRILSLLILIATFQLQGQNITSFEYYFETDPGFGNATGIGANTNTGEITQDLIIPVTGLNEGFHRLYIRALDDGGNWSLFDACNFYILDNTTGPVPISNLDDAEYWFDADPGFGNGTPLTFTGNPSEVTESYVISLGNLEEGFHTLRIRTKNLDGTWGLYTRSNFYIVDNTVGGIPISELAALEYWFGTDPGFGNGTQITLSGNPTEFTDSYVIPITGLEEGFETITFRAQNLDGDWSLFDKRTFYISEIPGSDPISNLQKLEYWIDTDPGFGNATEIDIPGTPSDYAEPLVIAVGDLDGGFHEIGIRAQNEDGTWSLYEKRQFFIFDNDDFITPPIAPITEIEYLYDAELGFGSGTPLAFTPTGNPDEYLIEIPTDLVTCDIHDIWISMKDANGNYSQYQILDDVDVFDNQDPTIVVFSDITVELDASGQGSITISDVDNGTFDDCELVSVVLDQPQINYSCADLGANTVTVTATDAENKVSTLDVTVTVVDNIDPVAVAQDITVSLDSTGSISITGDDLENGSTDNCSIVTRSVDITDFNCTNLGDNTVNFTVTDIAGNTDTVSVTVTVQDTTDPTVQTENLTVQLDTSGSATITVDDIDDNSFDNCTIVTRVIDINTFDCSNLGANTVTLTVTDQSGNESAATATVTVEDNIDPIAVTQDITVQLDVSGNATVVTGDIENGSTDNCTIVSSSLDVTSFDCSNLGANTVTLTVTDSSGNIGTATAIVTVEDSQDPLAIGQDITVPLDASGNATISAVDVDNGSNDNCAIDNRSIDISSFDCDNIGDNTITLTVTDGSGNTDSTTVTVEIIDNLDPIANGQDITVDLLGMGSITIVAADVDNGSSDNCGTTVLSIDVDTFTEQGMYPVVLTVTDSSGNTSTVTVTVTVTDSLSIDDHQYSPNDIKIYPNPVFETLYLDTDLVIDKIQIIDLTGKMILEKVHPGKSLFVRNLEVGTYFIIFNFEQKKIVRQFIKN